MGWQDGTPVEQAAPAWMQGKPVGEIMPTKDEESPSVMDQVKRQVGLTVRAAGPTAAGAAAGAALGAPLGGIGAIPGAMAGAGAMGITQLIDSLAGTNYVGKAMDALGVPSPSTPTERVVGNAASAMAGVPASMGVGQALQSLASPLAQRIGALLQSSPGLQVTSAATGGASSGGAREAGAGPIGQMAAGIAGASVPAIAAQVPSMVRSGLGGGAQAADRLKVLTDAGITEPSAGLTTGNRAVQATESGLSRLPGSAGTLIKAGEKVASDMGEKVGSLADSVRPGAGVVNAGVDVKKGIGKFVENFRAMQDTLYNALDDHIAPDTMVPATNVQKALAKVTAVIPGAENTSQVIANPKIDALKAAVLADVEKGGMPYQALKELRSAIGAKINNPSLTDDIPTSQWRQIYGALSDDMREAAKQAGPAAERAFNRANKYTKFGHERIETYLNDVVNKDAPEQVYRALTSGMSDGGSKVQAVMKSLPESERATVRATAIRRLGTATPGNQNAEGDVFSSQTFLTNWNKISPQAKAVLFSGQDGKLRESLDQIAKAAEMIKQGSKVFGNPSGTAQAISNQTVGLGTIGALLLGQPVVAATGAGAMGTANLSARLLTSPAFVNWLAGASKTPNMAPVVIAGQLASVAKMERDPEKRAEIDRLRESIAQ